MTTALGKAEIKKLQSIAIQCPYEGGYGVYSARALLSAMDNTVYSNTCESGMPNKSGLKLAPSGSDTTGNFRGISVYPNPANDKLNVALDLKDGQTATLTVYDLTGKLALSSIITGNSIVEVSTFILSEGLYIYKIDIDNTLVKTGKLSIIR